MKRIVIALVLSVAVAVLLCACLYRILSGAGVTWKNAGFTDEEFLVLLFPAEGNTSCTRAVLASLSEYNREFLEIYADGAAVTVPRSDFTPVPPQDYGAYVERLNRKLDAWGAETDWTRIQYAMTPSEEGGRATVTVKDKRGTLREYTYLIKGDCVQAVHVTTHVNVARNMAQ